MASFEEQVEALIGLDATSATNPSQDEISTFLTDGANDVINKFRKLDPGAARLFASISSDGGGGVYVDGDIIDVYGSESSYDRPATEIAASMKGLVGDADSLHYRSAYHPVFYREGKKVTVLPSGGSVVHLSKPSVTYGASNILDFPEQYYYLVVLYGAIQSLKTILANKSVTSASTIPSLVSITTFPNTTGTLTIISVPPDTPSAPSLSYSSAALSATFSDITTTLSGATAGSYTTRYDGSLLATFASFSSLGTLDLTTVSSPIAPEAPSLTYTDSSLQNEALTLLKTLQGTAPAYTKPIVALSSFGSFSSLANLDLDTGITVPTAPNSPTLSYIDSSVQDSVTTFTKTLSGNAPLYVQPSIDSDFEDLNDSDLWGNIGTTNTLNTIVTAVPPDVPTSPSLSYASASIQNAVSDFSKTLTGTAPEYTPASINADFEDFNDSDLYSSITFSSSTAVPVAPAAPSLTYTDAALQNSVDAVTLAFSNTPPVYTDPGDFASDFGIAGDYIVNSQDVELANATLSKINSHLSAYQSDMQNKLNVFNDANTEYQAELQRVVAEFNQDIGAKLQKMQVSTNIDLQNKAKGLDKEINQYNQELAKYQAELQQYQAEVSTEVQEHQVTLNLAMQAWQGRQANVLQNFQMDMQNNLNEFQEANTEYQARTQADLAELNGAVQASVQKMQISSNIDLQNKAKDLDKEINEYNQQIARYQAEIQEFQAELGMQIQEFQQQVAVVTQAWQNRQANVLQKYQTDIQDNLNVFQASNTKYQSEVQRDMAELGGVIQASIQKMQISSNIDTQNKAKQLDRQINEYNQQIAKYQAELQEYQANVSKKVQEHQQNIQKDLQAWTQEQNQAIQEYQANMQNELNKFNEANTEYQARVQADLAELGGEQQRVLQTMQLSTNVDTQNKAKQLDKEINEYNQKIAKYQAELQQYQADTAKKVQEHQQNIGTDLQSWTTEQANKVAKYQADIQDSLNVFNDGNAEYQAEVQRIMAEFNSQVQRELEEMRLSTNVDLQNKAKDLDKEINEYNQKIAKYQAELQSYQAEVSSEVQEYQQNIQRELSAWQQEEGLKLQAYQSDIQKYQAELQADTIDYDWTERQRVALQQQYDNAFIATSRPAQEEQPERRARA